MKEIVIPFFDFEVSLADPQPGVKELLKLVRPLWPTESVQCQTFDKGLVNIMMCCYLASDECKIEALVVRVYRPKYAGLCTRQNEVAALSLGHEAGCNQPVVAIFKNGIVVGYAQGEHVSIGDISKPEIARLTVQKLAKLKAVDIDNYMIKDSRGHQYTISKEENPLIRKIRQAITSIPGELFLNVKGFPSQQDFLSEFDELVQYLDGLNSPRVFCHNSVHVRNVIFDQEKGTVNLIDFEVINYAYEHTELGFMLLGTDVFSWLGWCNKDVRELDQKTTLMWIRFYLEAKAELAGQSDVSPEEVNTFYEIFNKCRLLIYPRLIIFSLLENATASDNHWAQSSVVLSIWNKYHKEKKAILSI